MGRQVIVTLQTEIRDKFLLYRNIDRILRTEKFTLAFEQITLEEQIKVVKYAKDGNIDALKTWIRFQYMESKNIIELRQMASRYGIKGCSQLPKQFLLAEITKCQNVQ